MLGLVSYDSSDEDEVETTTPLESTVWTISHVPHLVLTVCVTAQ